MKKRRRVLGWCERIKLPELSVASIRVKVDSGARTSALHAENIRVTREGTVRFSMLPKKNRKRTLQIEVPLVGYRKVRSSVGTETERPVIRTLLQLGDESWPIEITLVNRDIMGFRMLLGRSAIQHGFLIDPVHTYLLPRPRRKR